MAGPRSFARPLRAHTYVAGMDAIAIVLALVVFAILLVSVELLDRV
jgi:hypothetical protein